MVLGTCWLYRGVLVSVEITLCFAPCIPESGTTEGPPPIRLVGSNVTNEGRVELLLQGQWGTVCDDYWSTTDAQVINRCFVQQDLRKKNPQALSSALTTFHSGCYNLGPLGSACQSYICRWRKVCC